MQLLVTATRRTWMDWITMFVCEASAEYFLNTFHGRQEESDVAILILSTNGTEFVGELIDNVSQMDVALGQQIGLFLFGSSVEAIGHQQGSTVHLVPGTRIETGFRTARDFFAPPPRGLFIPPDIKANIATRMNEISVDFCDLLGIDEAKLPAVCVLFRGWEEVIVTSTSDRMNFPALSRAATALKRGLDGLSARLEAELLGANQLAAVVKKLELGEQKRNINRDGAINALRTLERRYGLVIVPQAQAMFTAGTVTVDKVATLVREQRADEWQAIELSKSWKGAARSIAAWIAGRDNVRALADGSLASNIISRREYLERFGDEITATVRIALADSGLPVRRYGDYRVPMSKLGTAMDFASKVAQLVGKVSALKALF